MNVQILKTKISDGKQVAEISKKTSTLTFRLDDKIIEKLRAESKNRQISTNTLVNHALRRFLEWDMYQPVIGFVSITKPVCVEIFKKLTQKEIIEMATNVTKNEIHDMALFMKGKMDVGSFMPWYEMRMVNSSAKASQKSSKSLAGSSFLLPAMIAALMPPIEVPATISNFILCLCNVLYTPHSYAPSEPPPCNTRTVSKFKIFTC